jgi:uncharacterized protein YjiS (DUF1127 family)
MTDLSSTGLALPRSARRADLPHFLAKALSWAWLHWRRRQIINALRQVDARLLRDVGIEPSEVEEVVDSLIARRR